MPNTTNELIILHRAILRNLHQRQSIENMMPEGTAKESQLLDIDDVYYNLVNQAQKLAPMPQDATLIV